MTYVKEKIIASNYSLEVAHAFSTIHPMHVKLACSRGMARLINLVRQCQISFYISIPAYSTSTDTFHMRLSHPHQVFHQSAMSGLHFLLELVPYFETRGLIILFLHDLSDDSRCRWESTKIEFGQLPVVSSLLHPS